MNTYTIITFKSKLLKYINPLCTKLFYLSSNPSVYSLNTIAEMVTFQFSVQNSYMLFNPYPTNVENTVRS
jgi:hypothetical protein